jgi:DNA (cytosine-5)-methyltransferase 1
MFGLGVLRHRLFETSWFLLQPGHPDHEGGIVTGEYITVAGNSNGVPAWTLRKRRELGLDPARFKGESSQPRRQTAMGIPWLKNKALVQAIPPAYAEWIGKQALSRSERWKEMRDRGFIQAWRAGSP